MLTISANIYKLTSSMLPFQSAMLVKKPRNTLQFAVLEDGSNAQRKICYLPTLLPSHLLHPHSCFNTESKYHLPLSTWFPSHVVFPQKGQFYSILPYFWDNIVLPCHDIFPLLFYHSRPLGKNCSEVYSNQALAQDQFHTMWALWVWSVVLDHGPHLDKTQQCTTSGPTPDPQNLNLHFNKIPGGFILLK